jgi:hypothetical protein
LRHLRSDIPRQQFLDAVDRMVSDTLQDMMQLAFGIEVVEFGGAQDRVDRGSPLTAVI